MAYWDDFKNNSKALVFLSMAQDKTGQPYRECKINKYIINKSKPNGMCLVVNYSLRKIDVKLPEG